MLMNERHHLYRAPDESGGAATADAAGAAPDGAAETAEQPPTFTQADLDRILADRLERQKKKLLKELDQAKDEEATRQLESAAEWQKLAEKRQAQLAERDGRITELEAAAALVEKYGVALDAYVTQLADGLPAPILALLAPMDAAAKLEWLAANRAQFAQPAATETSGQPAQRAAIPQTPRPRTDQPLTDAERRKRAARTF